jgi:branched-chain amino acid transport system substrate-binding protein
VTLHLTSIGRQPSWLPSAFLASLPGVLIAAAIALAPFSAAQAEDRDIRVVAVDSSRVTDPQEGAEPQAVPSPVGESVEKIAHDINRRGGLLGRQLAVVRENDRCEGDEAVAIARRVVERGAQIVVGHVCSSGAIRAAEIYAEAGVVMIATGPRHPRLTAPAGRRGIHRLAGRDDRQAESIVTLIATAFSRARMAIIHDQSVQGRGMADEVRRSAVAANIAPALVAAYSAGTKDYEALVGQIIDAKIDLVVFSGEALEASIILDQARSAGSRIETAIGTDTMAADAPPARLVAATREFLVMLPWPGQSPGVVAGTRPGDARPESARLLAGAAAELWARAIGHARSLALDSVIEALKLPASATGIGTIHFDDKGDAVVPSFVPHVWREGRWQLRR